jgi:hypothetical protein
LSKKREKKEKKKKKCARDRERGSEGKGSWRRRKLKSTFHRCSIAFSHSSHSLSLFRALLSRSLPHRSHSRIIFSASTLPQLERKPSSTSTEGRKKLIRHRKPRGHRRRHHLPFFDLDLDLDLLF